jgi:hypothetical protein
MACPYFFPLRKMDESWRLNPARAPLGAMHTGLCCADPDNKSTPPDAILTEYCNFGYGRGYCSRFPCNAPADAVRFTPMNAKILYVLERDCSPVQHGTVDLGTNDRGDDLLMRQARTFAIYSPMGPRHL